MQNLRNLTYGIVGLGLMGGSLAKAIRENILGVPGASGSIVGFDINEASLAAARAEHVLDGVYTTSNVDEMLTRCDFVYICLYPHATVDFLQKHKESFKSGAIISDISGVKSLIFDDLKSLVRPDIDYIPGHPMAGSEREGYAMSSGKVFKNHNYILMPLPTSKTEDVELFKALITELGFTRIVETDARVHDHKIAFTSQLCHVIASALVDSAEDTAVTAFGGGSFEDLTRIAMINAPLWTELFLSNKKELLSHIERFEQSLGKLKRFIEGGNATELESCLELVRTKRESMSRIDIKA